MTYIGTTRNLLVVLCCSAGILPAVLFLGFAPGALEGNASLLPPCLCASVANPRDSSLATLQFPLDFIVYLW